MSMADLLRSIVKKRNLALVENHNQLVSLRKLKREALMLDEAVALERQIE